MDKTSKSNAVISKKGIVTAKIFASAVSVQGSWPAYDMLSSSYNYTSGNLFAKGWLGCIGVLFIEIHYRV